MFLLDLEVFCFSRVTRYFLKSGLQLALDIFERAIDSRAPAPTWCRIETRIVSKCVTRLRSAGLAPDIVCLAETAFRSRLRVVVSHRLHFRDLLVQFIQVIIGQIIESGIQAQASQRSLAFGKIPVDVEFIIG